jgi:minor fimbrial subunit
MPESGDKMKRVITLSTALLLCSWSINAWSFACKTASGAIIPIGGGSANVYVNLAPVLNVGENLVVDLSTEIFCRNDRDDRIDYVSLQKGSAYGGVLENFRGSVRYSGRSYPFPLNVETAHRTYNFNELSLEPWPVQLYLTPVSSAGGVVIRGGSLFSTLILHQRNNVGQEADYIWNIYAINDVVIPTGGCDVSARDVTVKLPDYPGSAAIPLSVHCAKNQNLGYYLSGTTADSANTIFTNTASTSAAKGIGVQLSRNGSIMSTNKTASLGTVGTSPVNLGLTASYARTSGQVTAGNVQSIIGVTFVYQ